VTKIYALQFPEREKKKKKRKRVHLDIIEGSVLLFLGE